MKCPQCGKEMGEVTGKCACGYDPADSARASDQHQAVTRNASNKATPAKKGRRRIWVDNLPRRMIIKGRYRIKKRVGSGAGGTVYQVEDKVCKNKLRALKFINPDLLKKDRSARKRFRDEADKYSDLQHPNIVKLIIREEWKGVDYLVMEFLKGRTLRKELEKKKQIPWDTVSQWMKQILSAVEFVHAKGVIHRDLKPENLMLAKDTQRGVVVMDFGQAKAAESPRHTFGGKSIGTMGYRSPEQVRSPHDVTRQTDLFALGIIAYELLTGELFVAGVPGAWGRLPPNIRDRVPRRVYKWVLQAMHHDLGKRFKSAKAMLEAMPSRSGRKSIGKRKEKAPPARVKGQELVREHRARPGSYVETHAGLNLEMVWIAGGSFLMGSRLSPEAVAQEFGGNAVWFEDEHPRHPVDLDGFWLGRYAVTQRQYEALMGKKPSNLKGTDRPVENVTWDEAMEFCRKLSRATGKQYTLPTEAQWEFACRAGSEDEWACGNNPKDLGEFAWFLGNSEGYTHAVGGRRPNAWGLYDMHGNVWEWCRDWYDATFYQKCQDQGVVRNPVNEGKSAARVIRGGAWRLNAPDCRSASRGYYALGARNNGIGFRFVRTHGKP